MPQVTPPYQDSIAKCRVELNDTVVCYGSTEGVVGYYLNARDLFYVNISVTE